MRVRPDGELCELDVWFTLRNAKLFGWVDPGYTETIEETVKRAEDYLAALSSPRTPAP